MGDGGPAEDQGGLKGGLLFLPVDPLQHYKLDGFEL